MKGKSCFTAEKLIKNESSIHNIFRSGVLKTGMKELDVMTGGFLPGELICVAGREAMGSTGLALSILRNVCVKEKKTCLYFSLAENGRALLSRLVANVSHNMDILEPEYEHRLREILRSIEKSPLYINEKAYLLKSIERACEKLIRKTTIDLVIIDYHQLIRTGKKEDSSIVSIRLKQLSRSINCPVIVLCHLDKRIDLRENQMPLLSDLKGVGEMNHYADKVLFLYREDYYDFDTDNKGVAKIFVVKNNNSGNVGEVILFHKGAGIFESVPKHPKHYRRTIRNDHQLQILHSRKR